MTLSRKFRAAKADMNIAKNETSAIFIKKDKKKQIIAGEKAMDKSAIDFSGKLEQGEIPASAKKHAAKNLPPDSKTGEIQPDEEEFNETEEIIDEDEILPHVLDEEDEDIDFQDEPRSLPEGLTHSDPDELPCQSETRLPSTGGPRDNLQLYLREVSRFPMLKPEEEHELAVRARDHNDPDAAFRLVSSHLRLVVRIAMDFQRRWMQNVLDLVQEGNVGLLRAINKFDPDKGIKFSYYASFWIRAYILKFIMDNWRMVKIGTTQVQRKLFYNLNRERQKLIAQGFDPDAAMLSERLGVSVEQINEMDQRLASTDVSLNMQVGEDNGASTKMDFLPALGPAVEETLASSEITNLIRRQMKVILPGLNEKEQYILNHRLLADDPMTLREIGERYNVTRERVRQLEARLLEKIRKHLTLDIKDFSQEWIES